MLKALTGQGMLDYIPYQGVHLTEEGRHAALQVIRRHRLLELFLIETLGMTWSEVHEEAELLEHALSDKLTDRIDAFLGEPRHDPHGDPIPTRDGVMPRQKGQPLETLCEGAEAVIQRVMTQHSPMLDYFDEKGLVPGARLRVIEVAPFRGPLTVELVGRGLRVSVSLETARLLKVRPDPATGDETEEDH
jgi:DtxR family Mn-dependent transcriptional regulator